MTDDKTRQATAPGDDNAQLEGQTMLEGFAPEPEADPDAPPPGYRPMTPEEKERLEKAVNAQLDKIDRFTESLTVFYHDIYKPGLRGLEEAELLMSDPATAKYEPGGALESLAQAFAATEVVNADMLKEAIGETLRKLHDAQTAIEEGLPAIRYFLESGLNLPNEFNAFLTKAEKNAEPVLELVKHAIARWENYSPDDMQQMLSNVGARALELLSNLPPEELEKLALELSESPTETPETISTVLEEAAIEVLKSGNMRQGTANNAFTKIKSTKRNTKVDPITHTATITQGDMVVTIPNWDKLTGLKTSAYQLLDACTTALTNSGWKRPQVAIRLSDYMQLRGLKDEKEARKQVNADLETLFNARISFKEKRRGKNARNYADMRICDYKGIKNGIIYFSFGSTFFELMKSYTIMPVQPQLFRLNNKRNPNSYYLLRRLMEHKNMNVGKLNEDIISVKTLLEACKEGIHSYEEVERTDRAFTRRIITPFERDMDALEDTLTWEYCHSTGAPLTDTELERLDYSTFSDLLVHVHWKDYPDQTARMERKQARIEEAKTKKKRGRKPKKPPAE